MEALISLRKTHKLSTYMQAFLECVEGSDDFTACSRFNLRWFTPAIEVPLCGHATLAAAAALILGRACGDPLNTLLYNQLILIHLYPLFTIPF